MWEQRLGLYLRLVARGSTIRVLYYYVPFFQDIADAISSLK